MEEQIMVAYEVKTIGTISSNEQGALIRLDPEYIPALKALDGFSHINVFSGSVILTITNTETYWKRNSHIKKFLKRWECLLQDRRSVPIPWH